MTAQRNFRTLLDARMAEGKSVCIGLDADVNKIPDGLDQVEFCRRIIEATADLAVAFKPNSAFFERDVAGLERLRSVVQCAHELAPGVPVIYDAKRGDIGNTNNGYVEAAFDEVIDADAITVHNYMGQEAMKPFLDCETKGVFVLCRTSNPGAGEFQDLLVRVPTEESDGERSYPPSYMHLYEYVALRMRRWNYNRNCGVVVGATYPDELKVVRSLVGDDMPILIPGVGAQGGDVEATVKAGRNADGTGMIINSSRGIIFADDPARAARELHESIAHYLEA